jgi:hypothetical protein
MAFANRLSASERPALDSQGWLLLHLAGGRQFPEGFGVVSLLGVAPLE